MDHQLRHEPSLILFKEATRITFDNITGEYNYRKCSFFNFLSYLSLLVSIFLQFLFLASDIYTLIQIYALNDWEEFHVITYIPVLTYRITFTVCIGISFIYLIVTWVLGFFIQRRNRVVPSYLHTGARQIDSLKSYERFCIYEEVQSKKVHDWICLSIYTGYHYELINWLLADSPRQILNGVTIAYSVSNKFTSGELGMILSDIAKTNKKEAVLLSFMFFSFVVWLCFTFKNFIIILSSICIIPNIKRKKKTKFNKYCADLVAARVYKLYNSKAKMNEEELSKRRKVPSFIKNTNVEDFSFITEDYNDGTEDFDIVDPLRADQTNELTNDSVVSLEKLNPFDSYSQVSEFPLSHSRVNLVPKASLHRRSPSKNRVFTNNEYELHEITMSDPHNDAPHSKTTNHYDNGVKPTTDYSHSTNSPFCISEAETQDCGIRESYVYIPSKVYEEVYHQQSPLNGKPPRIVFETEGNPSSESSTSPQYTPTSSKNREHASHRKDPKYDGVDTDGEESEDDDDDEEEEDYIKIGQTSYGNPKRGNSRTLYGSRGLANHRTII